MARPEIRQVGADEAQDILSVINAASQAYRGNIPSDCWREPYMSASELEAELDAGVTFSGISLESRLVAVMGIQPMLNVRLIRHAYVRPERQKEGLGGALLAQICGGDGRQILIGTWRAATWAVAFYERHGFGLVSPEVMAQLLGTYWQIPERQIEESVVLARPFVDATRAAALIADARR